MLKQSEARRRMPAPQMDAFFFQPATQRLKASELFRIEFRVFGESHHRACDSRRSSPGQIAYQSGGFEMRNPHATYPGVHADMNRDGSVKFCGKAIEEVADWRVDHRSDAAPERLVKVLFIERPHQQNRLANPRVAQCDGLVKFHYCEAIDPCHWLKQSGGIGHSHPIPIVFFFNETASTEIYTLSLHDARVHRRGSPSA